MRTFGGDVSYTQPNGFAPWDATRIPLSVQRRSDHRTYPSGSPVNPGYAYGTFIPLTDRGMGLTRFQAPYTVPVAPNKFNQVRIKTNTQTQWINPLRALRLKGLSISVPGADHSNDMGTQQYLGNAQG